MDSAHHHKPQSYSNREPVVTAKKYLEYKRQNGHIGEFTPPKIILVCYQHSTLFYFLNKHTDIQQCSYFRDLYFMRDGDIGILGGWGFGAPSLAVKMEQMIALGVKKFVAIGTAGTLMNRFNIGDLVIATKALPEDGVAQHYLPDHTSFAEPSYRMVNDWMEFVGQKKSEKFHKSHAWSYSALFKESPADILRVSDLNCGVVEMEAATFYAVAKEKDCEALSLFVVSDSITLEDWVPHIKEPRVRSQLDRLAELAMEFCFKEAAK